MLVINNGWKTIYNPGGRSHDISQKRGTEELEPSFMPPYELGKTIKTCAARSVGLMKFWGDYE